MSKDYIKKNRHGPSFERNSLKSHACWRQSLKNMKTQGKYNFALRGAKSKTPNSEQSNRLDTRSSSLVVHVQFMLLLFALLMLLASSVFRYELLTGYILWEWSIAYWHVKISFYIQQYLKMLIMRIHAQNYIFIYFIK